jgi:hypothetical protein
MQVTVVMSARHSDETGAAFVVFTVDGETAIAHSDASQTCDEMDQRSSFHDQKEQYSQTYTR